MSSHWNARLMFAKAKTPSDGRSCILLLSPSLTMTLLINEELLFVMLFFGFFRLLASLEFGATSNAVPSPNAGAEPNDKGASLEFALPSLPLMVGSLELSSCGCSCILDCPRPVAVTPLYWRGDGRASRLINDTLVPAVAGWGFVASGFGLMMGASDGCGGGVARCKSSLRT